MSNFLQWQSFSLIQVDLIFIAVQMFRLECSLTWSCTTSITCDLPQSRIQESDAGRDHHLYNAVGISQEGNRLSNMHTNSFASLPSFGTNYKNNSTSQPEGKTEQANSLNWCKWMTKWMHGVCYLEKIYSKEKYVLHIQYLLQWCTLCSTCKYCLRKWIIAPMEIA